MQQNKYVQDHSMEILLPPTHSPSRRNSNIIKGRKEDHAGPMQINSDTYPEMWLRSFPLCVCLCAEDRERRVLKGGWKNN